MNGGCFPTQEPGLHGHRELCCIAAASSIDCCIATASSIDKLTAPSSISKLTAATQPAATQPAAATSATDAYTDPHARPRRRGDTHGSAGSRSEAGFGAAQGAAFAAHRQAAQAAAKAAQASAEAAQASAKAAQAAPPETDAEVPPGAHDNLQDSQGAPPQRARVHHQDREGLQSDATSEAPPKAAPAPPSEAAQATASEAAPPWLSGLHQPWISRRVPATGSSVDQHTAALRAAAAAIGCQSGARQHAGRDVPCRRKSASELLRMAGAYRLSQRSPHHEHQGRASAQDLLRSSSSICYFVSEPQAESSQSVIQTSAFWLPHL